MTRLILGVALTATALTGCGGSPPTGPVTLRAQAFLDAVSQDQGEQACALLVPDAASGLTSGGTTCAKEILDLGLPAGTTETTQVWGDEARVDAAGRALFLTRWEDGWRITAAGCEPRAGRPYDCEVEA